MTTLPENPLPVTPAPVNPPSQIIGLVTSLAGTGISLLAARGGNWTFVAIGLSVVVLPALQHIWHTYWTGPAHTKAALKAAVEAQVGETFNDPELIQQLLAALQAAKPKTIVPPTA